ncbi:CsoS2 family carboxysome shell protein [Serpentinimonas maccroryi]|uniref:CsoS2 family carboxysome shell protein n=1 Tax=Serpentinimonas maccroryi TaxID=1458426 RepID=UPI0020339B37|nr:CsoS2 family carboxysome shell protein [Serpentinimonas maccroryi]MCM2478935.1 hypothetical protein [Serpentinimonas maccroryi]
MQPALNHANLTLSGRDLARMRRQAMATEGKVGAAKRVAAAVRASQVATQAVQAAQATALRDEAQCGCSGAADAVCACKAVATVSAPAKASAALPNGRVLARARRQTLALEGKVGIQKVVNASRIAATMPDRADWQTALVQGATGRQLAMQKRIVQSLAGRTEASHHSGNRSAAGRTRSRAAAERTEVGHTLSGQAVSGIQVERSSKVTGQELGTCRNVTGTEYIGMEQFPAWCESKPQPRPPKVGLSQTTGQQQSVSGTEVDPLPRVTGNQTGACLGITGTQYLSAETAQLCKEQPLQGPHKVSVMSSRGQQSVTGVVVNGGSKVTGNEAGLLRPITGTQYARAVQAAPSRMPAAEARQAVAEHGQAQRQSASWRAQSLTGDRPGIGGGSVTGDERGACEPVTGTPFVGPDNQHAACTIDSAWLTRHPELAVETPPAAPKGFSIVRPQRGQAAGRASSPQSGPQSAPQRNQVTGVAYGNSERITGPGFKAQGMITGTPEFRHGGHTRRGTASAVSAAPAPAVQPPARERLSGEGRQQGSRLTGDAWGSSRHISGTDGVSAQSRNPTQLGQPRGMGMDARSVREQARAEVPQSPVTDSSGSTGRGAMVTVSGGARG